MHYIIYKTTNLVNGKFYIGKHQTNNLNDGYVGSGKLLKRAIKKHGSNNFKTEIIEFCSSEAHMNLAEKIYVVVDREVSYNLCPGGKGGFGYINENGLNWNLEKNKSISGFKHLTKQQRTSFARRGHERAHYKLTKSNRDRHEESQRYWITLYNAYTSKYKKVSSFCREENIYHDVTLVRRKFRELARTE